ncbi:MAG: IS110 family transposase [Nitrospiraceae bacterium]|nr:IS110 family transposase [Nitrospiraceae bacterium]
MYKLFVGVDISKETSSAHGLDENGESRFSMTFSMNEEGFSKLYKALKSNCKDLAKAMVAMESTACYHINLFSFLNSKGTDAFVINPLLIANFAKLSLRKTKTDKKDALTIARFILANKDSVSQIAISQDLQDLRDLARERESLTDQISESKTEIKRLLQTLFPELETICEVHTMVMLDLLQEFPSARAVKSCKAQGNRASA